MVVVLSQTLPKKPVEGVRALSAVHDSERLKLAVTGARMMAFDWTLTDDRISWEGAGDLLAFHSDPDRLRHGEAFRAWMSPVGRYQLESVIERKAEKDCAFEFEFEAASALGTVWFEMRGVRIADSGGAAERLTGVMRSITDNKLEAQRLTYLATRDELTGHLNRTSLRSELANAIEAAKAEERTCAYIVASIDRLAMINEAYGFGAADEVIVAVGERISGTLRSSDIIGRIAGNKLGVILASCSEREIALVAERLRAAVRDSVIETRTGTVSATISVGAVLLPVSASSSQEAMLRAEEALDRARSAGRDGFAVYSKSAQRETARLRLMAIADEVVAALNERRLVFAYQPIVAADTRKTVHYECLLRMARTDGTIAAAGQFIPAAEQLGLVRLVDRHALEMAVAQLRAHAELSLAVNVSGTTASDPSWLQSFINYVRANRGIGRFRGKRAFRLQPARSGLSRGHRRFRRGLYLVPQSADAARRHGQDRRHLRARPCLLARQSDLRAHACASGQELRSEDGRRMGELGRGRGPSGKFRRRLFPGFPFRRARHRAGMGERRLTIYGKFAI